MHALTEVREKKGSPVLQGGGPQGFLGKSHSAVAVGYWDPEAELGPNTE